MLRISPINPTINSSDLAIHEIIQCTSQHGRRHRPKEDKDLTLESLISNLSSRAACASRSPCRRSESSQNRSILTCSSAVRAHYSFSLEPSALPIPVHRQDSMSSDTYRKTPACASCFSKFSRGIDGNNTAHLHLVGRTGCSLLATLLPSVWNSNLHHLRTLKHCLRNALLLRLWRPHLFNKLMNSTRQFWLP